MVFFIETSCWGEAAGRMEINDGLEILRLLRPYPVYEGVAENSLTALLYKIGLLCQKKSPVVNRADSQIKPWAG